MNFVILNGEVTERNLAKVDIEDRGYQFGDGIYEVIRVYNGQMFASDGHMKRLCECAEKINLVLPFTNTEIELKLNNLIQINQLESGIVYLQFTRGVAPRNHAFPAKDTKASFVAYTKEMDRPLEAVKSGIKAALVEDIRWLHCDIKSLNLLGNILAKQSAADSGCTEAILHRDQTVTEGSSTNTAIIKNGVLYTHEADRYILNGITRQIILELCRKNNISYVEKAFTIEELMSADEAFVSSTTLEISPVIDVDGTKIGNGRPGPVTVQLQHMFEAEINRQCGKL